MEQPGRPDPTTPLQPFLAPETPTLVKLVDEFRITRYF